MRGLLLLVLCLSAAPSWAANWSGILDSARAMDWTTAGAGTSMVTRTTACASLTSTATAATINAAIQACPAGQYVSLAAGTYTIGSPGLTLSKSNVTLRGAGANSTFLNFTGAQDCGVGGGSSGIAGASVCMGVTSAPSFSNTASWTAGYAKGATSITLSSKTNLQVGSMVKLGQARETIENQNIYNCQGTGCTFSGGNAPWGTGTEQGQLVLVTSISGGACPCTIGISPSLNMPNWRSSQNPTASWPTALPLTGIGLENLSLNYDGIQQVNGIMSLYTTNSWVKGVRSVNPGYAAGNGSHHVRMLWAKNFTVRDSYFWGMKTHAQESYGIDPVIVSDLLVENNIFQYVTSPVVNEGCTGCVYAYNYSIDDFNESNYASMSIWTHALGNSYLLYESNDSASGLALDNYHGPAFFVTMFRNRAMGPESGNIEQTATLYVLSYNRYTNLVGNVLGDNAFHTNYQKRAGLDTTDLTTCNHSIYAIGYGNVCELGNGSTSPNNDLLSHSTMVRWGNYDTVTDTARFLSAEVPSGITPYPNALPATQQIPSSFYLDGRPPYFAASGVSWPAIGPDVTGGSETGVGGHNLKIPARRCFETVMGGAFGQRTTPRAFNPTTCYGTNNTYQVTALTSAAVQTAVNLAQDTDTVWMPAGTYTFSSTISFTDKNITIRGAGQNVTVVNSSSGADPVVSITPNTKGNFRITGISFHANLGGGGNIVKMYAVTPPNTHLTLPNDRFRIDHVDMHAVSSGTSAVLISIEGIRHGLLDHWHCWTEPAVPVPNCFDVISQVIGTSGAVGDNAVSPRLAGYHALIQPLGLGTDAQVVSEDCILERSSGNNAGHWNGDYGSKITVRHCQLLGSAHFQTHAARANEVGGLITEVYNNIIDGQNISGGVTTGNMISGTGIYANNTIKNDSLWWGFPNTLLLQCQRISGSGCEVGGSPLGFCSGSNPYDGRIEANGWPCFNQPGTGAGAPGAQELVPIYIWGNGAEDTCSDPTASGPACTYTKSVIGTTCSGILGTYIKTTTHTNGAKDYCVQNSGTMPTSCGTHTNTYVPLTYPHPLQGGGAAAAVTADTTPPAAPTGVTITKAVR